MVAGLPGRTGILPKDIRQVVREQRLGFVATACPDGPPNLSPKGTTAVWDGDHPSSPTSGRRGRWPTCAGTLSWR